MEKIYYEFQSQNESGEIFNSQNDIYKNHNANGSNIMVILTIARGCVLLVAGVILCLKLSDIGGLTLLKETWILWGAIFFVGFQDLNEQFRILYYKYPYRKNILENGTAYQAKVEGFYECRRSSRSGNSANHHTEYELVISYESKTFSMIVQQNPENYLENPYCTVYEFGKKVIAADFKVKEQYITEKGLLR